MTFRIPVPVNKLSAETLLTIENKIDLKLPSQRYFRSLLIGNLICDVIDNYTIYPDSEQKKDMARSIICAFSHLRQ